MTSVIAAKLRSQGYRLTPQRLMMLEVLASAGAHISAEEIHSAVAARYPYVNLSTVYRTLDMLSAEGIVRPAHLGGGKRLYEMASEADPHHHLVCRSCGRIQHIAARHLHPVETHLLDEHDFRVEETHLTSFGTCRQCPKKTR